jgi:hypothetical protein
MNIVKLLKQRREIISLELQKIDEIINLYSCLGVEKIFEETDSFLYKRPVKKRVFQNNIGDTAREIAREIALQNGVARTLEVAMELRNRGYILNEKDGITRVANYLSRSSCLKSSKLGWKIQ